MVRRNPNLGIDIGHARTSLKQLAFIGHAAMHNPCSEMAAALISGPGARLRIGFLTIAL